VSLAHVVVPFRGHVVYRLLCAHVPYLCFDTQVVSGFTCRANEPRVPGQERGLPATETRRLRIGPPWIMTITWCLSQDTQQCRDLGKL
jgi:hypothetical protein